MFAIGSPVQGFVDAIKAALEADTALMAVVTAVTGHVSETDRAVYPYLVIGRRSKSDGGAMTVAGNRLTVQLDWWSDHRGPSEAQTIGGHVARILERAPLRIAGYDVIAGSMTCELEEVFDEPDADMPGQKLYHGVQRWTAEVHETN